MAKCECYEHQIATKMPIDNSYSCISILHHPGDDPNMYEQASERWSPVQSVEKVILSVVSMLAGKVFIAASLAAQSYSL